MIINGRAYCNLCGKWMEDYKPRNGKRVFCCNEHADIAKTRYNNFKRIGVRDEQMYGLRVL